ncbi:AcrR family transcriptional regulator [Lipingzhangella halophila]|uniref:AcrR family transcriptional regulator n=1 Tax=Lipingzhangella halophila TaxID=1783352 RepID=A0A7W7W5N3_9ACTN|nr:TetR/AcrR family transcriptional regulator [Lipingzhangella halophila]MBB4934966.1 AcrR family transcriptional regulator [Lipingzhangella halophila]
MAAHATQGERTEASRRRIIEAGIKVLADEGYRNMTVARIQEVAGLSRGLVGYHFGGKQGLLEAIISGIRDDYINQVVNRLDSGDLSGLDSILRMIETYLDRLGSQPDRHKVLLVLMVESLGELPELRPASQSLNAVMRGQFRGWLTKGTEDGTVRPDADPAVEAGLFEALLRGITLQWLVDPDGFDLAAAKRRALDMTRRSLAP